MCWLLRSAKACPGLDFGRCKAVGRRDRRCFGGHRRLRLYGLAATGRIVRQRCAELGIVSSIETGGKTPR